DIVHERSDEDINAEIQENAETLVDALNSFGVKVEFLGATRGPSVTRYELLPASGVKISKITGLADDIALNLGAEGVRIEPVPNKKAVGIEVANKKVDSVPFREMVESTEFVETTSKLGSVLGKSISGEVVIADIAKMPHVLIAGTTGSGKSVCVNSIIMSILFRSTPDDVRLLMIDPKAVEFMIYNGIPHLLIPVVTDPKKAAGALAWAVTEMLNRYKLFSDNNVRDLGGYNKLAKTRDDIQPLPQIVIFIDELADLMMAAPGETEDSICRLAQMARAAGMHLVIATQRPSVNVVTGVIKANIPSRIALKVASQVDSRTIIDSAGAEKLLGKGDMLYFPVGMAKPMRVQGCWVSDKEVERVVDFIKNSFVLDYDQKVIEEIEKQAELAAQKAAGGKNEDDGGGDIDVNDEKLDEAIEAVIEAGQASTSYLQRKLKLGYGRAARLIDTMEELGVVGPYEGSKPRQVLMTKQDWYERKMNKEE
ncbi:MAG: DNA translocase FtsK, partial [Ruminiclostridium sp.]|nr:DNA translocase FtsK [Ruminiclostridium sp.]